MARAKQSRGTCIYCDNTYARGGMTRHLQACAARQQAMAAADQGKSEPIYHLKIGDEYDSNFWLHLEMAGSQPLARLDRYLRAIWLECCGHLSAFFLGSAWSEEVDMDRRLKQAFSQTEQLTHVYDFGTSSHTVVRVVDQRRGQPTTDYPIALMARNEMPTYLCQVCQEPATHLCMECLYEEEASGLLCEQHTDSHPHDDYGEPMPLTNSPRVGLCGYEGPAEPPY